MKNRKICTYCFFFSLVCFVLFPNVQAQSAHSNHKKEIGIKSKLWNTCFNSRDSLTFYTLFDTTAIVTTPAGRWIGAEQCKGLCRGLYKRRPDITWYNQLTKTEVNEQWHVAYETGNWTETWTESGDTSKSEIKGKYWIMWVYRDNTWKIISAIFTPLSCKGSYCKSR